jgi:hypothetical protein
LKDIELYAKKLSALKKKMAMLEAAEGDEEDVSSELKTESEEEPKEEKEVSDVVDTPDEGEMSVEEIKEYLTPKKKVVKTEGVLTIASGPKGSAPKAPGKVKGKK